MSTIPIHHSPEHAAGPGADPESGHREGQLTNRSCAQVSDTDGRSHTHTPCVIQIEIEDKSGKHPTNPCAVSGCALWME